MFLYRINNFHGFSTEYFALGFGAIRCRFPNPPDGVRMPRKQKRAVSSADKSRASTTGPSACLTLTVGRKLYTQSLKMCDCYHFSPRIMFSPYSYSSCRSRYLYLLKKRIRMIRIKLLIRPHNSHMILCFRQIDNIVGITRKHMHMKPRWISVYAQ